MSEEIWRDTGPIGLNITDNDQHKVDHDSQPSENLVFYASGSIYNNTSTCVTVTVQVSTTDGTKAAPVGVCPGGHLKFKRVRLHSIQQRNGIANLYVIMEGFVTIESIKDPSWEY